MNFDKIKLYLPKYLSPESDKTLFQNLKDFPNNIDERMFTNSLMNSKIWFQGDGIVEMPIINLPNTKINEKKAIIISNTCDIDPANKRNFPAQVVYAPIFKLSKYKEVIIQNSSKSESQIMGHIESIKKQKITQIFYIPRINNVIDESIVFFDRVNSISTNYIEKKNIDTNKLFTLSDYGLYMFILKISIHFTRIRDNVDRNKGIY